MFTTPWPTLAFVAFVAFAGLFLWRTAIGETRRRAERIRRERFAADECIFCGCSLAGNDTGVCPECGKAAEVPEPEPPDFFEPIPGQIPGGRSLFTTASTISLGLCIAVGVTFVCTTRVTMYDPGPDFTFHTVRGLGRTCVSLAGLTFVLFLKRGHEIRAFDDRIRRGLCPRCGYDLRDSRGKCPECGEDVAGE